MAGLLLAPKSGAELRGDLAESTGRLRRHVMDASNTASETIGDMIDKGRKAYARGRDAARQASAESSRADAHAGD